MSANNQAEPAAAVAAAASSPAASASEYLKRTCLICGCQTNQAINIYEPRSGPNIVQLIQAKFKFQPLNEDKFLCFSCNNWLINWHSLQAVNSNDADSQSRSQSPSHMGNNLGSGALVQQRGKVRPVAQVRPQPKVQVAPQLATAQPAPTPAPAVHFQVTTPLISYNKRRFERRTAASTRGMRKVLRYCRICGAAMVLRLLNATPAQMLTKLSRRSMRSQCRKCRESELTKLRTLHQRSQAKLAQLQRALGSQQSDQTLVSASSSRPGLPYQRFQAPRVDGKVVAMFRRLGTTLSSEQEPTASVRPLRIMSPVKQRPRWTRALDEDEILLEFDSIITEVLPTATTPTAQAITVRRRLRYQVDSTQEAETEANVKVAEENRKNFAKVKVTHQTHVNLAGLHLPQGLSITLI